MEILLCSYLQMICLGPNRVLQMCHIRLQSCNMCTITRKCRCSIYGQSFYLAPDIRTCKNASVKTTSYLHHFNLAPLLHVMDESWHKVLNLSGNLTDLEPIKVPSLEILKLDEQLSKSSAFGRC